MKIFVYGTLMKGYWNHHFLKNSKYIGVGKIENYDMYHVSSFPGIIKGEGFIEGEVYEIDSNTLELIDGLEGEGKLYIRKKEDVIMGNEVVEAYVYIWNGFVNDYDKVENMPWKPKLGGRFL